MPQHFLSLKNFPKSVLETWLTRAEEFKDLKAKQSLPKPLRDKTQVLVFEKSSTRTRVAFEVAFSLLGGASVYLNQDVSQLGRGESYADTARVLSSYADVLVMRTFADEALQEFAQNAEVPVINALTDREHPCQILADLLTLQQQFGDSWCEKQIIYLGDFNNISYSLVQAAQIFGFSLVLCGPKPPKNRSSSHACIIHDKDPSRAIQNADVIYTDTWVSMGEENKTHDLSELQPYQVNENLLASAKDAVKIMHNLPAHPGEEITREVLESDASLVFAQAENKLYVHMALLEALVA